jgi:hypothetical protein
MPCVRPDTAIVWVEDAVHCLYGWPSRDGPISTLLQSWRRRQAVVTMPGRFHHTKVSTDTFVELLHLYCSGLIATLCSVSSGLITKVCRREGARINRSRPVKLGELQGYSRVRKRDAPRQKSQSCRKNSGGTFRDASYRVNDFGELPTKCRTQQLCI